MRLLLAFLILSLPACSTEPLRAVKAGRLLDVRSGAYLADPVVLIEGDRIKAVGSRLPVPEGAQVTDLGDATLLPGLIDCHVHLTARLWSGSFLDNTFRRSPIDQAITAHLGAKATLEAGFTTVRNLSAEEWGDVALRDAISRGDIPGPRMQVSGLALSATGGHGDLVGYSPYLQFTNASGIADGEDAIRRMVRLNVKRGADVIKVSATAGVISEEETVGGPQYSQRELDTLVEEARMWGRKVAAHAHGAEGIRRAVKAGVASIEHGSFLDEEGLRLMKERGTYLVADVYCDDYILAEFAKLGFPERVMEKERAVGLAQRQAFQRAVKAGVKIAFGTDAAIFPHGWNAKQFALMVKWGCTPLQAIQAATLHAADLLGWSDRVGSLESGKFADLIAVPGNPLEDIRQLEKIHFVMKGGAVVRR